MAIDFNLFDELPKNWKTARVKNILDYNHHYPIGDGDHGSIKPEMYQDEGIPYLRVQNLSWGFEINYDNLVYISDEVNLANSKSILIPNDILIAKTGATVGKMAIVPKSMKQANTTSSVGKITINHDLFNHKYFAYLFLSPIFQEQIREKAYQKSAQPGFNIDDLIEFKVIIPPISSQKQIANYLDKKTAKIDTTIAKNKELITLLEEKRTALINQVVTKGLNPEVPMKDSGIEWIGEIPEHWDVRKFGHLINLITKGATPTSYGFDFQDEGINFIKVESISKNGNFIKTKFNFISKECDNFLSRSKMKEGDLLFSIAGALGRVAIVDKTILPANTNQALSIIRINNDVLLTKYIFYALKSDYSIYQINENTVQSAQANLSMESIREFKVLIPPLSEQKEIITNLNNRTEVIDKTISKIKKNIKLLEEYYTSLIHHVVTGKIDVRGEEI
jgi:type I restriction enzyme S subunit